MKESLFEENIQGKIIRRNREITLEHYMERVQRVNIL